MSSTQMAKLISVWALLVLGGFAYLVHYSATAGDGDDAVPDWPSGSRITRQDGQATLVVFMHPACPCSRATVNELARIVARSGTPFEVLAVFVRPAGFAEGWEQTDLWENAARIPRVRCIADPGGRDARQFGAATSGYTLLYDAEGALVFHGGITGARGHEGDNAGEAAILSWLRHGVALAPDTPVFGCALLDR